MLNNSHQTCFNKVFRMKRQNLYIISWHYCLFLSFDPKVSLNPIKPVLEYLVQLSWMWIWNLDNQRDWDIQWRPSNRKSKFSQSRGKNQRRDPEISIRYILEISTFNPSTCMPCKIPDITFSCCSLICFSFFPLV